MTVEELVDLLLETKRLHGDNLEVCAGEERLGISIGLGEKNCHAKSGEFYHKKVVVLTARKSS